MSSQTTNANFGTGCFGFGEEVGDAAVAGDNGVGGDLPGVGVAADSRSLPPDSTSQ